MKNIIRSAFAVFAFAATALAESMPLGAFDTCQGGDLTIHVSGWAYDPDASSQSIDVFVNIYTDSACTSLYNFPRLTANVSRPDVNQAKGITGNHGFNADISVPAGTYWVQIMAIDKTANTPYEISQQVGPTRSATVLPALPGSGTAADPYRISSVANWDAFATRVNAGAGSSARYRLDADIGSVTSTVGTQDHPFRGTFDGSGHTLTLSLSGTETYLAPFSAIGGATISNLVVAGTVAGGMHCSGLVGIIVDGTSVIENCEVAAAISSSRSHFGGFIGHSITNAVTLRGCVFSGSISGGTYVATFHGWSDDGATTTLIDCFDASGSDQPIGRGADAACVSNTYYFASKDFSNGERLWSAAKRGKQAYTVTEGEYVAIDFGAPAATYGTTGIVAYPTGMDRNSTFFAGQGDVLPLYLVAAPPFDMILDTYVASAGTLSRSGSDWTLAMPGGPVVVGASMTAAVARNKVQLWAGGPYWAETNVGADEPWETGLSFWWGDTVGYRRENGAWAASDGLSSNFSFTDANTPTYGKGSATLQSEGWITADGVLEPAHDAAHIKWGGSWRMPTDQELIDLTTNCDWTWTTTNGVSGYVVRGRNDFVGASIFLPCTGNGAGTSLNNSGSHGRYWSSVLLSGNNSGSWGLGFDVGGSSAGYSDRYLGQSVRPVKTLPAAITVSFNANGGSESLPSQSCIPGEAYGSLPTATRTGYVFAGWFTDGRGGTQVTTASVVPASATTLYAHWTSDGTHNKVQLWADGPHWAETNIGADEPWDYGYYFWWGDTVGYRRENNAWVASDGSSSAFSFDSGCARTYEKHPATLQSEGWITADGVLAPAHDAAHVQWGGDWRMPTDQELSGLVNNCDWTWTTINGVNGYVVRGRGNFADASIFLPLAGRGYRTSLDYPGTDGDYWSSVPLAGNSGNAWYLALYPNDQDTADIYRFRGQTIRPVQTVPVPITVSFDANGGSEAPPAQSYMPGEAYGSLPTATRTGYVFAGWFTDGRGGTQVTTASVVPASATTLYAHWTPDGTHNKVQLWANGPYWAETNIGADEPWDYGYYFWWGDTVGYRRENNAWVANDGSSSSFSFNSAPTYGKHTSTLSNEGWITANGVLASAHDAAHVQWGGYWRMPTDQELADLVNNCDWTRTTINGVNGYVVRGRGNFADASIFLPLAGRGYGTSLDYAGSEGDYWSSVPLSGNSGDAWHLALNSGDQSTASVFRFRGQTIRPVWLPIDLSSLTADYTAEDGDVLTGTTAYNVTVPAGATVTINGVAVTGGGTTLPAPAFAAGGEAVTTKFERGAGDTWVITAFAELDNDAIGADVPDDAITVYRGDAVGGVTNAVAPTITRKSSAVKVEMTVDAPANAPQQFFKVKVGE